MIGNIIIGAILLAVVSWAGVKSYRNMQATAAPVAAAASLREKAHVRALMLAGQVRVIAPISDSACKAHEKHHCSFCARVYACRKNAGSRCR